MRPVPHKDWTGAVDASKDLLEAVHPPALIDTLSIADEYPVAVACTYSGCARMFVGNDTTSTNGMTLDTRRFWTVTGVGVVQGRMYVTTSSSGPDQGGAQGTDITIETTSGGGVPSAAAYVITTPSQSYGTAGYMDVGSISNQALHYQTGDTIDNTPGATMDRMLELAEALAPALEEVEITNVCGCSIAGVVWSKDMDAL